MTPLPPSGEDPRPTRVREAARWLVAATIAAGFGAHFLIVGIGLFPDNPVSHQYKYERMGYVYPFFSQNWSLFAPNPINSNMNVLYQFDAYRDGQLERSEWVDAMQPLVEAKRAHFWSPVQRLTKFLTGAMQGVNEAHNQALEYVQKTDSLSADTTAAQAFYDRSMRATLSHRALEQYAESVFFQYAGADAAAYDSVRATYSVHVARFPRFSKRDLDYFDLDHYEFAQRLGPTFRLHGVRRSSLSGTDA